MPPRSRPTCEICQISESKYNCPKCRTPYCSLGCYKTHQEQPICDSTSVVAPSESSKSRPTVHTESKENDAETGEPLRPLTSLKWPYVPEESAYPDPLKRDDPKVVQLSQYEAIATSVAVRKALSEFPNLRPLLCSIDSLRGAERELAIQRALGVSQTDYQGNSAINKVGVVEEDIDAMRQLSSAVEAAIRRDRQNTLGLDLDDE